MNLVVVAHPDDEVLGFGGTGAKLAAAGEIVQPVILCGDVDARGKRPKDDELFEDMLASNEMLGFNQPVLGAFPNIRMNNVDHIEMVSFIEQQIIRFQPTRVFTHHPADLNNDHLHVSRACLASCRLPQRVEGLEHIESVYYMEILSSTDWSYAQSPQIFCPNTFVEVEKYLSIKLKALDRYRGVMRSFPHSRSIEVLRGLAAVRGGQSGLKYAESFQRIFSMSL